MLAGFVSLFFSKREGAVIYFGIYSHLIFNLHDLQIFTGNSAVCMKVADHQVQKVMTLVAKHRSDVPQFLDLLSAIVKVEELDLPLKRNQTYVMTYFMQYRTEIAYVIDQSKEER